ncbi:MAG: AraC family transcriptional regulator [Williamsia sp.]|nr:AraC family transcriptional regulator [Williamsia sp.]
MNQHFLKKDCKELHAFPHIIEYALKKNATIQFDSLKKEISSCLRFYYVIDGRFDWVINGQSHILYPGDLAIVAPGQSFGGEKDFLDIGTVSWLCLGIQQWDSDGGMTMGGWSQLTDSECSAIGKFMLVNGSPIVSKLNEAGNLFVTMHNEFTNQEIGYVVRINQLIDELFILIIRHLMRQNNFRRDFPQAFLQLEKTLRENLSHQWTVEEMAALVGLGNTAFSERVKLFTGFSPLNYLINIRISEAIKLLNLSDMHVTDVALEVGFYSSQHFSTTFKKLTGYTPREFRKKNIPIED